MMEMEDGHYVGYWTAPLDWTAEAAQIRVIAKDDYGNKTEKLADGKLYINVPNKKSEAGTDLP